MVRLKGIELFSTRFNLGGTLVAVIGLGIDTVKHRLYIVVSLFGRARHRCHRGLPGVSVHSATSLSVHYFLSEVVALSRQTLHLLLQLLALILCRLRSLILHCAKLVLVFDFTDPLVVVILNLSDFLFELLDTTALSCLPSLGLIGNFHSF